MSAMEDHTYLPLDQKPPLQVNIPSATSVFPTCQPSYVSYDDKFTIEDQNLQLVEKENQKKKQRTYGRALNDISNTHPIKKSSTIITPKKIGVKEVEVQTMTIETRTLGTQTSEEDVLSHISFNHVDLSKHSYSKPKISTPVKVSTMEPMDLDFSNIETPTEIYDNLSYSDSSDSPIKDDKKADPEFVLESSSSISSDESVTDVQNNSISEKTFIVFGCALEMLMSLVLCSICGSDTMITSMCIVGTKLIVDFHCINNHDFTWKSQPDAGKMAKGNIAMASAILLWCFL
ncbi:hypothetical protein ACF0H5_013194 [Mactra antiquata]